MLRIDPNLPLLWRDPHTLQIGTDPVLAIVPEVTEEVTRLLAALQGGIPESRYQVIAASLGINKKRATLLRARLAAGLNIFVKPSAAPKHRALIQGEGSLAIQLAHLLDALSLRGDEPAETSLAVLVSSWVISPINHRHWLSADTPHLPVILSDTSITVGPLVHPGYSACLRCTFLRRRDLDPAWPALASQLAVLTPPAPHPLREAAAVSFIARLVAETLGAEPLEDNFRRTGIEYRITGEGDAFTARAIVPHPRCHCTNPPETDSLYARAPAKLRE